MANVHALNAEATLQIQNQVHQTGLDSCKADWIAINESTTSTSVSAVGAGAAAVAAVGVPGPQSRK